MSKASEWASQRRIRAGRYSAYVWLGDDDKPNIQLDGWLFGFRIPPEAALPIAQWILDTFGEKP